MKTIFKKYLNLNNYPHWLKEGVIVFGLVLITVFVYRFLITSPDTVILGDGPRTNGYQAMIIKYSLKHFGQLAFWDQFQSGGMSWISHPSGYHFSPLAWFTIWLFDDPRLAARFMELVYVIFACVSFYVFLRVIGLSRATGFFVSIPYTTNQYIVPLTINGWSEELMSFFLLPLTTIFLWIGLTRTSYLYMAIGGLVMSLHFRENSFYVFHFNAIVLLWITLILGIGILWKNRKEKRKIVLTKFTNFICLNFVFWLLFIGISAAKLFPILEFRELSARSFSPLAQIENPHDVMPFSFLYQQLRHFIVMVTYSDNLSNWGNNIAFFLVIFAGIYFLLKKSKTYGIFIGLLAIGIWGYLANRVPIDFYAFMYYFLPGFSSNRFPFRFIVIISFAFFVCVAMGLDILIRQRKTFWIARLLGYSLGIILIFSSILFALKIFNMPIPYRSFDLKGELKKDYNFGIIRDKSYNLPPEITGDVPEKLLIILTKIIKKYKPEGRIYSNFVSGDNAISKIHLIQLLFGELPSMEHNNENIIPTYQYGVIKKGSTEDSLELTKMRYKVFSVLNMRFQMQQKEFFEFEGCSKLTLSPLSEVEQKNRKNEVCKFLENRLDPLAIRNDGSIYFDKDVLPKVAVIPYSILLIGDNRFNDFSGFIAKQLMFHKDFDEKRITILSSKRNLEDYSLDELKKFPAIIFVNPKIKDKNNYEYLKQEYKKNGKLLKLNSKWIHYESLHERSGSIWTENSAWNYSDNDSKVLSELFRNLSSQNNQQGIVKIQKFTPEDLIFETDNKEENVVLQFSDSYYPGWKAEVNGKKTSVYMADGLVKGVVIPEKGKHTIRMFYSPDSFKIGAGITTFTIGILSILGFYTAKKSLKKKSIKLTDIIFGIGSFLKKSQEDSMNLFQSLIRGLKESPKYLVVLASFLILIILFSPIFLNNVASFGDLPYYWDTYLKSLSLPQIWNPHWPTGLGGNQTIILPLKFYTQILMLPLIGNLGLSWEIYHKIFFASVFIVLSVWTSFLLTRSWIGSLIYSTNTWILLVFSGGQMGIALSYAIIPLVLIAFQSVIKQLSLRTSLFFSLIFSIQLMFDQRMALITLGIILILLVYKTLKNPPSVSQLQKKLFLLLIIPAAIFALNLYWVLPLLFSRIIGASALSAITGGSGQASFFSFAFFENSISLLHPNYPENIFGKVSFMKPEFIILPVIAFSGLLFSKSERFNKVLIYALIGLIGAFLAKGTNEPFGAVYTWLFQNVPGFSLFRDPTKFYVLVALSYTILISFVLNEISNGVLFFTKRFFKKSLSIALIHFLLSFVFIVFWGFTIRDSFLGNVGGIFKETRVPQEYTQLKDYLVSQSDFSRTLWIPTRQRFGYFSDNHPAIDGYDLFGRISPASMAARLENTDVQRLLTNLSIKYIVVPFDNQGEIFLTDRKYDESLWQKTIERLDESRSLNKDARFGKLRLYKTRVYNGRFYIQQSDGKTIPNLPYQRVDNTEYLVSIKGAKAGDALVFSEGYDLGWQATSEDVKIFPIPRERLINGFVLPRDGDYSFEVYYIPQSASGVGFVVSGVVLLLTISTLVYLKSKEIKK